jgi:glycosyltransferase involved in cell wall biosynthesis
MIQESEKEPKINILHLVHGLSMGGAEVALFHYIKAFGNESYEHYVYCFGADGPVREKIESLGVPVCLGKKKGTIKKPISFILGLISLIRDIMCFIRSKRIQIIQSHSGHANQLGVAIGKLSGLPSFPTVHSTMAFIDSRSHWDLRVFLRKAVNGIIYRVAECVLAVSQEIKEIVQRKYRLKDSKVLVLKNGIVFEGNLLKTAAMQDELFHSDGKLKVIAVGRLVDLKGYDVLVKAIGEIVDQGFNHINVRIAGEGEERARLEELIRKLKLQGFVELLGLRHDILQLMKFSDIFVMSSRFEGLSIAMIEAMACGLPIIASDAPGLREHVENEQNGLLFPSMDHKALAERILKLANNKSLRTSLSLEAKNTFKTEYDMRQNILPLKKLFREYVTN